MVRLLVLWFSSMRDLFGPFSSPPPCKIFPPFTFATWPPFTTADRDPNLIGRLFRYYLSSLTVSFAVIGPPPASGSSLSFFFFFFFSFFSFPLP